MNKERKALCEKATDYILHGSTIANQLKALYLEADSSLLQLERVKQRMDSVFRTIGVTTKANPDLEALREYFMAVKRAEYFFEQFVGKMIIDATWGANEGENRTISYDNWHADSNTLARLIMLFLDRTYHDTEQQDKVFELLESMKPHGQFNEEDYKYFTAKYPKRDESDTQSGNN